MNIKFSKGTYRAALVLGPITFKIIYPRWIFFRGLFRGICKTGYFGILEGAWGILKIRIIRAMFANITEFFTWKSLKPSFLAPTYFSCGFFNIQKTIVGAEVNCPDLVRRIIDSLPKSSIGRWQFIEGHLLWFYRDWETDRKSVV